MHLFISPAPVDPGGRRCYDIAMEVTDITIEILKSIRDEVRQTNVRLDRLTERVDLLSERMDRMEQRQVEGELRLASEITQVVQAIHGVRDLLLEQVTLRPQVQDHEKRILAIEARLGS